MKRIYSEADVNYRTLNTPIGGFVNDPGDDEDEMEMEDWE